MAQGGGVFTTHTLDYDSHDYKELTRLNAELLGALGLERGAAHAEFIRGAADGEFYFLEVAARVGGAFIAETLEAATGHNLWREWARVEVAHARGERVGQLVPRREFGGIALSLARQEHPTRCGYDDPRSLPRGHDTPPRRPRRRSTDPARVRPCSTILARASHRDFSAPSRRPTRGVNLL